MSGLLRAFIYGSEDWDRPDWDAEDWGYVLEGSVGLLKAQAVAGRLRGYV